MCGDDGNSNSGGEGDSSDSGGGGVTGGVSGGDDDGSSTSDGDGSGCCSGDGGDGGSSGGGGVCGIVLVFCNYLASSVKGKSGHRRRGYVSSCVSIVCVFACLFGESWAVAGSWLVAGFVRLAVCMRFYGWIVLFVCIFKLFDCLLGC